MVKFDVDYYIDCLHRVLHEKKLELDDFEDAVRKMKNEIFTIECTLLKFESLNERSK